MSEQGRYDGIDFWRGVVLCMILIDHMPGNSFENLTPRNFGFSDAAEAFVFLSGLSIALAYGRRFSVGERAGTLRSLGRRALKLYGAHILLSLLALAIFFLGAAWESKPELLNVHGRDLFVAHPTLGLLGLVSLGHQLGYFNILPLYMILIVCVPILLWFAEANCWAMLGGSALLYALARVFDWNLPNWPTSGNWFFDPFAWQMLFAIGIAIGLNLRTTVIPLSRPLLAVAAVIVAAGLIVVTGGFGFAPQFGETVRAVLDLNKTQLGLVRLAHFLALAYLIYGSTVTRRMRELPIYRPASLLGRHSLWVFAIVSLISAIWQAIVGAAPRALWFDALFLAAAIAIVYCAARFVETSAFPRATGRRQATPRFNARPHPST
jgi:hypothetical protein